MRISGFRAWGAVTIGAYIITYPISGGFLLKGSIRITVRGIMGFSIMITNTIFGGSFLYLKVSKPTIGVLIVTYTILGGSFLYL